MLKRTSCFPRALVYLRKALDQQLGQPFFSESPHSPTNTCTHTHFRTRWYSKLATDFIQFLKQKFLLNFLRHRNNGVRIYLLYDCYYRSKPVKNVMQNSKKILIQRVLTFMIFANFIFKRWIYYQLEISQIIISWQRYNSIRFCTTLLNIITFILQITSTK